MTGNGEEAPFIFIVAGEPSGDALGGALIRALRKRTGGRVRVAGIGGESMAEQGVASLVPLSDLAVAGIAEVLPRAPLILRRVRETVQAIRQLRPDAVVTIDSSGFSWRIAHRLRRHGERLPLIHYVAPMVWAWRPGRARRLARWYDHLLALLPFEPSYFEAVGLACSYVGHPVIESGADTGDAFPLWPHPACALSCAIDAWSEARPESLAVPDLLDELLPSLLTDSLRLAIFPVPAGDAVMVDPRDFRAHLEGELESHG